MTTRSRAVPKSVRVRITILGFSTIFLASIALSGQDVLPSVRPARIEDLKAAPSAQKSDAASHRFWDRTNAALFLGVGGARALDYASTRSFRGKGIEEVLLSNSIVDNKPLFAAIEAAGTAASIGVSYAFHRTGHHKIERWISIVHISVGVGASIRNFGLKPQPAATF